MTRCYAPFFQFTAIRGVGRFLVSERAAAVEFLHLDEEIVLVCQSVTLQPTSDPFQSGLGRPSNGHRRDFRPPSNGRSHQEHNAPTGATVSVTPVQMSAANAPGRARLHRWQYQRCLFVHRIYAANNRRSSFSLARVRVETRRAVGSTPLFR